jgi:hypothetical protein
MGREGNLGREGGTPFGKPWWDWAVFWREYYVFLGGIVRIIFRN